MNDQNHTPPQSQDDSDEQDVLEQEQFEIAAVEFQMRGRSGGEQIFNTSGRKGVTPAEFKILEHIHGRDAVRVVAREPGVAVDYAGKTQDGKKDLFNIRNHAEELDRLVSWYGRVIVEKVWGENPRLPFTFKEARIPTSIPKNVEALRPQITQAQRKALAKAAGGEGDRKTTV